MLLIYLDMIIISVVVIVGGLSMEMDHTTLYIVRCVVLIDPSLTWPDHYLFTG